MNIAHDDFPLSSTLELDIRRAGLASRVLITLEYPSLFAMSSGVSPSFLHKTMRAQQHSEIAFEKLFQVH